MRNNNLSNHRGVRRQADAPGSRRQAADAGADALSKMINEALLTGADETHQDQNDVQCKSSFNYSFCRYFMSQRARHRIA